MIFGLKFTACRKLPWCAGRLQYSASLTVLSPALVVLLRLADPRGSALTVPVHACTAYELVLNHLVVPVHMYCCTIACTVVDSFDEPVSHTSILYLCTNSL